MKEKEREKLKLILAALSQLEVRGSDNLGILLGCIEALEGLLGGGDAS